MGEDSRTVRPGDGAPAATTTPDPHLVDLARRWAEATGGSVRLAAVPTQRSPRTA